MPVDTRKRGSAHAAASGEGIERTLTPPTATPEPETAPAKTQETVSLSLETIVTELANHVPEEKRPQVEILRRLAVEKPDQHAKIKEQMMVVAGPDALRKAVSALLSGSAAVETRKAAPQPAMTTSADNAAPAHGAASAAPAGGPPMPNNLPAIFGSSASTPAELASFQAELVHALRCRAPACPIAGCVSLQPKLERLQAHVGSCSTEGCLLCSIWRYLRDLQAAHAAAADAAAGPHHTHRSLGGCAGATAGCPDPAPPPCRGSGNGSPD